MNHPKITNKTILVSGGTGSVGSVLVKTIIRDYQPKQVRILDNNEAGLFQAMRQYKNNQNVRCFLGDVRDKDRVNWAMRGVETIFHTAALKHVELNEYSPFESVKTNVLGTQNMLEAALLNNVETFINISTDKAANPTSTMGASKLLAERLTSGANNFKGNARTVFASVRFGNVLNSSGSVLPIWQEEIKQGQALTVTDKNMIRYFMTIEDAVNLICKAATVAKGGEVFILKMPALKIIDLAEILSEILSKPLKIKTVGKRQGEKLFEKIVTRTEASLALELPEMYVLPTAENRDWYQQNGGKGVPEEGVEPKKLMTKKEIKQLLIRIGIK